MEKKKKTKRMRELVELLNKARRAYEQENTEIMSNFEYDRLYDELLSLEKELETTLASSPTVNVGYEVLSELPKERHETPMLSLDKTKDVERLREFLGDQQAVISWKMDGLTIVLTYENGVLTAGAAGDVVLTAVHGGKEVGSVTIHAVIPESLAFTGSTITVPYGKTVALNIIATYGLNEVKFKASDIEFELSDNGVGSLDGILFTAGDGAVATSAITAT